MTGPRCIPDAQPAGPGFLLLASALALVNAGAAGVLGAIVYYESRRKGSRGTSSNRRFQG